MRGRSAGFQGSAAGNEELLTSASKRHISTKGRSATEGEEKAHRFISVKIEIGCNLFSFFFLPPQRHKVQCPL